MLHANRSNSDSWIQSLWHTLMQDVINSKKMDVLNTFSAWLVQAVHAKTACSHVTLHKPNSNAVSARELFKRWRLGKSCSLQWKNLFLVLGFRFFVSDVISGILLGHFGPNRLYFNKMWGLMKRSFTWNRFPIKIYDWFLACFICGVKLFEIHQFHNLALHYFIKHIYPCQLPIYNVK